MHVLEGGIIGGHAVILQARDDLHALFRHILLGQSDSDLLGAVIPEVEENHHVTLLDAAIDGRVDDGLDELIGYAFVIGFLDGSNHVIALLALTSGQHIVCHLNAVPVVVAVHSVVASNDGGDCTRTLLAVLGNGVDKSLAALRIGVTAIHEAVNIYPFQTVFLGDVAQCHQVLL